MLFRIAPTPSGYLHIGNAVNFVLTWLAARQLGGRILLRIDDLDADRKRPEYVTDIFQTIDYLGLDYDTGPTSPADVEASWSQRHRIDRYAGTLAALRETGMLYACGLTRKELQAYGDTYPAAGRGQNLSLNVSGLTWRFRAEGDGANDFIVRRRDGVSAYQIASLTDDHDFGVTHLVRGLDLLASTNRQRQLAHALGWGDFWNARVWHHPLLVGADGLKLSKSAGAGADPGTSIRALRERGAGPEIVFGYITHLLNIPAEAARSLTALRNSVALATRFSPVGTVKLS